MTNKEILRANLLDIIFENRNKEYGAYALRNEYDRRLLKALGIGLGLVVLLIVINFLKTSNTNRNYKPDEKTGLIITKINLDPDKIIELEKPKPIEKPKVAMVDFQPPKIVSDPEVKERLITVAETNHAVISNTTTPGKEDIKPGAKDLTTTGTVNSNVAEPLEFEPSFIIREQQPMFPGGPEAFAKFMRSNLITPEELDLGEKKIVKVKFIVGKDGSITDITILESPGRDYEKEVSRVIRKMPRWKPGIQNDITVAVAYVLPITFTAVED